MKRETLLTTAVVALLLLNFGTLGYLFFRRPPHPPGAGPKALERRIVETLALNTAQQDTFKRLKKVHHEQMLRSDQAYREALVNYFNLLKHNTVVPAEQDSLQGILSQIQQERARVTFQHFVDLKALCSPDQQQHFAELLPDLMQVILPGRPQVAPH